MEPTPIMKVVKLNLPEWRWMLIGTIGSALTGAFPFVFALILGELMGVSTLEQHLRYHKKYFEYILLGPVV